MPFGYGPFTFTEAGIGSLVESGGVYGLAKPSTSMFGSYTILYVGKTGNLRERLRAHLNNPPVSGITHFFAEAIASEAARTEREYALVQEFKPVGNTLLK
jgi:excinuclease UvrABC nuclease subunit